MLLLWFLICPNFALAVNGFLKIESAGLKFFAEHAENLLNSEMHSISIPDARVGGIVGVTLSHMRIGNLVSPRFTIKPYAKSVNVLASNGFFDIFGRFSTMFFSGRFNVRAYGVKFDFWTAFQFSNGKPQLKVSHCTASVSSIQLNLPDYPFVENIIRPFIVPKIKREANSLCKALYYGAQKANSLIKSFPSDFFFDENQHYGMKVSVSSYTGLTDGSALFDGNIEAIVSGRRCSAGATGFQCSNGHHMMDFCVSQHLAQCFLDGIVQSGELDQVITPSDSSRLRINCSDKICIEDVIPGLGAVFGQNSPVFIKVSFNHNPMISLKENKLSVLLKPLIQVLPQDPRQNSAVTSAIDFAVAINMEVVFSLKGVQLVGSLKDMNTKISIYRAVPEIKKDQVKLSVLEFILEEGVQEKIENVLLKGYRIPQAYGIGLAETSTLQHNSGRLTFALDLIKK